MKLTYYEVCLNQQDATKREKYLKTSWGKRYIKNRLNNYLENYLTGWTAKYFVNKLVYYEEYQYIQDAIQREKQMKKRNRNWKIELIEKDNPAWEDFFKEME